MAIFYIDSLKIYDFEENGKMTGVIKGICISDERGTAKHQIEKVNLLKDWGLENDAHGGNWHRQVSLLSYEKIEEFRARGAEVMFGAFGENIIIEGIDLNEIKVGSRFTLGNALLELTQIGKECHSHCEIYKRMGDCIMPREGVFAKVIKDGEIKIGDTMEIIEGPEKRPLTAAVITLSDKGAKGEREDKSGPIIEEILLNHGYNVIERILLSDDQKTLERNLIRLSDQRQVNLILTTGGTGFSKRDMAPEATMAVATRNAPGIAEAMRAESLKITGRAMLSRGASVIRNDSLIINLPGSPKAAKENLEAIIDELEHGLNILLGRDGECGRS